MINIPGPACDPSIVKSACCPHVAVVKPFPDRVTRTPAAPLSTRAEYGEPGNGNPAKFKYRVWGPDKCGVNTHFT